MTTMNREDYLINILRLTENGGVAKTTELASYMGVSPASVSEMIKVLSADGLVNYEKYRGVTLTEEGMTYARQIRKRYHVLETFLMEYLELDHESAHEEACRMEHAISDESARKMCQMMGSNVDSDCSCCQEPCKAATDGTNRYVPLNTLSKDQTGKISHIKSDDNELVKKIVAIGVVPGKFVTLDSIISDGGPRMVRIGSSTMVVDYDMAQCIFVDVAPGSFVRIDQRDAGILPGFDPGEPGPLQLDHVVLLGEQRLLHQSLLDGAVGHQQLGLDRIGADPLDGPYAGLQEGYVVPDVLRGLGVLDVAQVLEPDLAGLCEEGGVAVAQINGPGGLQPVLPHAPLGVVGVLGGGSLDDVDAVDVVADGVLDEEEPVALGVDDVPVHAEQVVP